jgi:hypothetical protein
MRREIQQWAPWMDRTESDELIDRINQMAIWERKPKARPLGVRLNVTYAEREELKLWTIAPCDVTERGMALLRKRKKRQRDRQRRQLRGAKPHPSRGLLPELAAAHTITDSSKPIAQLRAK